MLPSRQTGRRVAFSAHSGSEEELSCATCRVRRQRPWGWATLHFFHRMAARSVFASNGRLMKMATGAEAPQEISPSRRRRPRGLDVVRGHLLRRVPTDSPTHGIRKCLAAGGEASDVSVLDRASGETFHGSPSSCRTAQTLLFTVTSRTSSGPTQRLAVQSIAGGAHRAILRGCAWGRYLGDGLLVYQRGESLFATRLNPRSLTVDGVGALVLDHVDRNLIHCRRGTTRRGFCLDRPADAKDFRIPVWVSPDGAESPLPGVRPDSYRSPRVAPNGGRISFWVTDGLKNDVVVYDVNREQVDRLTRDGLSRNGAWLPDSLALIVQRQEQADVSRLVTVDADSGSEGLVLRRDKGRLVCQRPHAGPEDACSTGEFVSRTGYYLLIAALGSTGPGAAVCRDERRRVRRTPGSKRTLGALCEDRQRQARLRASRAVSGWWRGTSDCHRRPGGALVFERT